VKGLEAARKIALSKPWTQPEWFLSKYPENYTSTCSEYATQRGVGQKVVAYSYYHIEPKLIKGMMLQVDNSFLYFPQNNIKTLSTSVGIYKHQNFDSK